MHHRRLLQAQPPSPPPWYAVCVTAPCPATGQEFYYCFGSGLATDGCQPVSQGPWPESQCAAQCIAPAKTAQQTVGACSDADGSGDALSSGGAAPGTTSAARQQQGSGAGRAARASGLAIAVLALLAVHVAWAFVV